MTFYPKKELKFPKSQDPILCIFACFEGNFSLRRALQMRKCIVEQCCGYLKHFLTQGKRQQKHYGHTMRRIEYKAGK